MDAVNFSEFFASSPAVESSPHLYISALNTWARGSPVGRQWGPHFGHLPLVSHSENNIQVPLISIPLCGTTFCLTLSSNCDQFAVGSSRGLVEVRDGRTGELLRDLEGPTDSIWSVAFSPDDRRIAGGSCDGSIWVWDARTGEQLWELRGHVGAVRSVRFSPSGNQIVSGSSDHSVRVWCLTTGNQLRELKGHWGRIDSAVFSPDGNWIASGSDDQSVRMWDAATGKQLRELKGHTRFVPAVGFSPDCRQVVSVSCDRTMRTWCAQTGEQLRVVEGPELFSSFAFSPNGRQIVSGSYTGLVQVWDAERGEELAELKGYMAAAGAVRYVGFSPDNRQILSASSRTLMVWDGSMSKSKGSREPISKGHAGSVISTAFSPDGGRIASGSSDGSMFVWDATTGEQLREFKGHRGPVKNVAFLDDGDRIISHSTESIRVWNAKTGKQLKVLQSHAGFRSFAFSHGHRAVAGSDDGLVHVLDVEFRQQLRVLAGHAEPVVSVAFSPDRDWIISASYSSVLLWNAQTGERIRGFEVMDQVKLECFSPDEHLRLPRPVAFSPNGDLVALGSPGGLVMIWDNETGEGLSLLVAWPAWISSLAFSPDGRLIVSDFDRSMRVWVAASGEEIHLEGLTESIYSPVFSPDSRRIVAGSGKGSVRIWDAETGVQLNELKGPTNESVKSVMFSFDGERIVSGSTDRSVRVWGNLNVDAPWFVDDDGWITSGADRLMWVHSTLRDILHHPHSILNISRLGSAKVSFEASKLGSRWTECYAPKEFIRS